MRSPPPSNGPRVETYQREVGSKSDLERTELTKEKTGVFTGAYAINPVNEERIPIWIADYVLMGYGTGAIMAVPAHDERDFEFAKQFGLEIRRVVQDAGDNPDNREGPDVPLQSRPFTWRRRLPSTPPLSEWTAHSLRRRLRSWPGLSNRDWGEERSTINFAIGSFRGSAIGGNRFRLFGKMAHIALLTKANFPLFNQQWKTSSRPARQSRRSAKLASG